MCVAVALARGEPGVSRGGMGRTVVGHIAGDVITITPGWAMTRCASRCWACTAAANTLRMSRANCASPAGTAIRSSELTAVS
jgi:hypothetical protein